MSRFLTDRYTAPMRDDVDELAEAWARERPDLDLAPVAVFSRISRLSRHLDLARRDAFAAYARIDADDEGLEIAFRRVPFDRAAVLETIAKSGRPHAESLSAEWQPRAGS